MDDFNLGIEHLPYLFFLLFAVVFGFTWLENHRKPLRNRRKDLQWYADNNPAAVVNNHVTCRVCGADTIGIRPGMKASHPQQHFCKQCDTVLYYSTKEP